MLQTSHQAPVIQQLIITLISNVSHLNNACESSNRSSIFDKTHFALPFLHHSDEDMQPDSDKCFQVFGLSWELLITTSHAAKKTETGYKSVTSLTELMAHHLLCLSAFYFREITY